MSEMKSLQKRITELEKEQEVQSRVREAHSENQKRQDELLTSSINGLSSGIDELKKIVATQAIDNRELTFKITSAIERQTESNSQMVEMQSEVRTLTVNQNAMLEREKMRGAVLKPVYVTAIRVVVTGALVLAGGAFVFLKING